MGSGRGKNYDINNLKKKIKRVNKRNAAVKEKHKRKKKLKTKVSSYEKAVQKFNESRQLNNLNTITNKRITTGRLKPQQCQVGMFLQGLRGSFVRLDPLSEARKNGDIKAIIDIGEKSRKEIFAKHKKCIQDGALKALCLDKRKPGKFSRVQDIVSNAIHVKKPSSRCSCEDESFGLTEINRRVPKGRLPDSERRCSALEEYCANALLKQLNSSKSSNNSSSRSLLKGLNEKDLDDSISLTNLGKSAINTNLDDLAFMNCSCSPRRRSNQKTQIDLDESRDSSFGPLSPLDKCTLSPISFPFQDQTEELINVKELSKEIQTTHFKSKRRKDDEKQTKPSESKERMDSIKESKEFARNYGVAVDSGIYPALDSSEGAIKKKINSLKQLYIRNLEKSKINYQRSEPDRIQFRHGTCTITPNNKFFMGEEEAKPTPFLNGFEFIIRKSEDFIEEDIFPDPILLSQEILPEMEFPDLIITPDSGKPQINAKTAGTDFRSRKSHLQIVTPNRRFYRRNMF